VLRYAGAALALHLVLWGVAVQTHPYEPPIVDGTPRKPIPSSPYRRAFVTPTVTGPVPTATASSTGASAPVRANAAPQDSRPRQREAPQAIATRAEAIEEARHAGFVDVIMPLGGGGAASDGQFVSLTGTGDISSGFDDSNIYGGLLGSDPPETGRFGGGAGGVITADGSGWGTIGTGRYGELGHHMPVPSNNLGRSAGPLVTICFPRAGADDCHADGALDIQVVRRMVKRQYSKLQYCFEREQLTSPDLKSVSVVLDVVIDADGSTPSVASTGDNGPVTACVRDVIDAIAFPRADGPTTARMKLTVHMPGSGA
jgi:hypothetical protein